MKPEDVKPSVCPITGYLKCLLLTFFIRSTDNQISEEIYCAGAGQGFRSGNSNALKNDSMSNSITYRIIYLLLLTNVMHLMATTLFLHCEI